MYCKNCGASIPDSAAECPVCKAKTAPEAAAPTGNTASQALRGMFRHPLYLAICITVSAAAVLGMKNGSGVVPLLFAAAAWITFGQARSEGGEMKLGGLRFTAVLLKIQYVLMWVGAGVVATVGTVCGILLMFFGKYAVYLAGSAIDYSADLNAELSNLLNLIMNTAESGAVIAGLVLMLAAGAAVAVIIVFNNCFIKHFLAYSERLFSAASGEAYSGSLFDGKIAIRMRVYGILLAVSSCSVITGIKTVSDSFAFVASLGVAAVYIIASVLIKEFEKKNI